MSVIKCFPMSINPLLDRFNSSVVRPLTNRGAEACCATQSLCKRVYQVGAAAFSGIGNWPFYGVADTFGKRYSSAFGSWLGACEFGSYFTFRLRNFEEIRQKFFIGSGNEIAEPAPIVQDPESLGRIHEREDSADSPSAIGEDEKGLIHSGRAASSENISKPTCCSKWKDIAIKTGIAALGLIAQFPLMVLVYNGNGQNPVYPAITGLCEASFTILSLWMTLKSSKKPVSDQRLDPELEVNQKILIGQINRFLEELPSKYNDPIFAQKIEDVFSNSPPKTEEQRGKAILDLVIEARGLPKLRNGSWDGTFSNLAKGLGLFISLYLTTVNGAVSYQGVKAWKSSQEALAVLTTVFVGLANIKLLNKVCMDSATSYYQGFRDIIMGQYRPPLAHAVSPKAWYVGRAISTVGSWFGFGTTAVGARDYIPKVGNGLMVPAPLSSALLLNENLNWSADDFLLWAKSKCDSKAERFNHINNSLLKFREIVENSKPAALQRFLDQLPNLRTQISPTQADPRTPLLLQGFTQ